MQKPSSLPKGWPHPTEADLAAKPKRLITMGGPDVQHYSFKNNSIKTSKYEWWNFLPKFLLEEFNPRQKIANCYFLVVSAMQCIPAITNTGGYPTVLIPLTVVLVIAGVFKALEDAARHKADRKANSSEALVFDNNSKAFVKQLWSAIRVGDYVKVESRETVPADMICVCVSEPNPELPKGLCYVETKSLDGETNLKMRQVVPALLGKIGRDSDLAKLSGGIEMEHPNNLIDSFLGVMDLEGKGRVPVQPTNVILRGCVLRSTDWMIGLVVNTGHDVKIMQSSLKTVIKSSNLERLAIRQIVGVIALLLIVCFSGSIGQVIFNQYKDVDSMWYLKWTLSPGEGFVIKFFSMLLLHASFIPVSLYVSMALVRFLQSYFMVNDLDMYYAPIDCAALVRTMTLNEELGQVSHIFSDKTGTLTCNVMDYRKASIHGIAYGRGITEIGKAAWKLQGKPIPPEVLLAEQRAAENSVLHVKFYDPDYERVMESITSGTAAAVAAAQKAGGRPGQPHQQQHLQQQYGSEQKRILEFYRYLSVCHEVVAEKMSDGSVKLSAPNPDDECLVCAAAYFGFSFKDRRDRYVFVQEKHTDALLEIEVLYTIPFTSTRKRMSVIIRDVDKKIRILTKGADSIMFSRIDPIDKDLIEKTRSDIDRFSQEGLRCLVLATAEIEPENFDMWSKHYDEANTDLNELDKRKHGEANDIDKLEGMIESNLHVVGATAIEDRLQEGVPECIEVLAEAGIKIWVLTGDKEETAINIAVACNLVQPLQYMDQVVVNSKTCPDAQSICTLFKGELRKMRLLANVSSFSIRSTDYRLSEDGNRIESSSGKRAGSPGGGGGNANTSKPRALIIDGPSLITIKGDKSAQSLLLQFSQQCKAVVCCRVSPDQKREIVDMIKHGVPGVRTLAVGDGANDVAMITAAHIGVGIKGEEGVQAVNASDYAIGQFRFLTPLLLKHGRFNYVRMCNVILYMFYKNIFMSATMFWFSFVNAFSSQKYFTEGAIQFFNLFYTSIPILLYGAYDMDVGRDDAVTYPQLYALCIKNFHFNSKIFWTWILQSIVDSVLSAMLPLYFLTNFDIHTGALNSFLEAGALCFTIVIVYCNLKLFQFQTNWYWYNIVISILSVGSWIGVAYIIDSLTFVDFDFHRLWSRLLKTGSFWLGLLIICTILYVKDVVVLYCERFIFYTPVHIIQEMNANRGDDHAPSRLIDQEPETRLNLKQEDGEGLELGFN